MQKYYLLFMQNLCSALSTAFFYASAEFMLEEKRRGENRREE
jgi:hypothetical protein